MILESHHLEGALPTQGRLSANRSAPAPAGRPSRAGGGGDTRFYMLGAGLWISRGAVGRFRASGSRVVLTIWISGAHYLD